MHGCITRADSRAPGAQGRPRRSTYRKVSVTLPADLLDSDGLSKAAIRGSSVRARLDAAERIEAEIAVSAVTLAEVLRGHPRDSHSAVGGPARSPRRGDLTA
jgi:hypothetical protein